jgi:hypothetical protein
MKNKPGMVFMSVTLTTGEAEVGGFQSEASSGQKNEALSEK